jgi:hypothetical protein
LPSLIEVTNVRQKCLTFKSSPTTIAVPLLSSRLGVIPGRRRVVRTSRCADRSLTQSSKVDFKIAITLDSFA